MTATAMAYAAQALLDALTEKQRHAARYAFADPLRTRWSYLPQPRPGVGLLDLDRTARKAAHRLLATALSRHAFAQAVTIMALEEVLDLDEGGRRGRHSDDYWVAIFGDPDQAHWSWRFEGHHLSVNVTIADGQALVAPLFFGANPARVHDPDDRLILGPLRAEEQLARALLIEFSPAQRPGAVVDEVAPADILTSTAPSVDRPLAPPGVSAADLPKAGRKILYRLLRLYLSRLTPALAEAEYARVPLDELNFAWAGGIRPEEGHYYRLQAPGLLIEYDNTQNGVNHAHTVLRRPGSDFGADLLPAHLAGER